MIKIWEDNQEFNNIESARNKTESVLFDNNLLFL